ncbi:MAG TPA: hypothetical protein PLD70_12040 [Thermotogota bacterium]|nr:hypothetical protein [Thermotogota bacterium]
MKRRLLSYSLAFSIIVLLSSCAWMGPGIIVPIEATPLNYPDASKVQKFFPGKNFKDKVEK